MDAKLKTEWVAALRSGMFNQHRGSLCNMDETEFCCVGVLWEVMGRPETFLGGGGVIWDDVFGKTMLSTLITLNDTEKRSFLEIADFIEANL